MDTVGITEKVGRVCSERKGLTLSWWETTCRRKNELVRDAEQRQLRKDRLITNLYGAEPLQIKYKKGGINMNKLKVEDIAAMIKANDFLKKEEEEKKFPRAILWALAIIGAIAAVAGIAYAVYLYFTPDYLEDFEDDFDDDFDDDFFDEEDTEKVDAKADETEE